MAGDREHISPPHKQWDRGEKRIIICNMVTDKMECE